MAHFFKKTFTSGTIKIRRCPNLPSLFAFVHMLDEALGLVLALPTAHFYHFSDTFDAF